MGVSSAASENLDWREPYFGSLSISCARPTPDPGCRSTSRHRLIVDVKWTGISRVATTPAGRLLESGHVNIMVTQLNTGKKYCLHGASLAHATQITDEP